MKRLAFMDRHEAIICCIVCQQFTRGPYCLPTIPRGQPRSARLVVPEDQPWPRREVVKNCHPGMESIGLIVTIYNTMSVLSDIPVQVVVSVKCAAK